MANVSTALSLTTKVVGIRYLAGGDVALDFTLVDSNGVVRTLKTYLLRADGSGVYDGLTQISATTPTAWLNAATALETQAENALTAAAAANKITF